MQNVIAAGVPDDPSILWVVASAVMFVLGLFSTVFTLQQRAQTNLLKGLVDNLQTRLLAVEKSNQDCNENVLRLGREIGRKDQAILILTRKNARLKAGERDDDTDEFVVKP